MLQDATQSVLLILLEERLGCDPDVWMQMMLQPDSSQRAELVRAISRVKKRLARRKKHVQASDDVLDCSGALQQERSTLWEAVGMLMADLTEFQQTVLRMSRDGWRPQDIADELQAPVCRVTNEKYKAIRKLRELLAT